jgi:alkylated DNA repair dioxygenase AlkB
MKLPLDCEAWYYSEFLTPAESEELFKAIAASCDLSDAVINMADGGQLQLGHGMFVFADAPLVETTRGDVFGARQRWIPAVHDVKEKVESVAKRTYDVCVGYHYKNGNAGFDYHSDLPAYTDISTLSCVSLGQERVFSFRRADNHEETYDLRLGDGSLLVMGEHCRERYEHGVPIDPAAKDARIVLVFMYTGWEQKPYHGRGPSRR